MDIIDYFDEEACSLSLKSRKKEKCLRELAELMAKPVNVSPEILEQALKNREEQGSTAFENGIAIPHARLEHVDKFTIGIALSQRGVDFKSLDNKRTNIFFLIVGPSDKPREFLRLLAQISLVAKNASVRRELMRARSTLSLKETFLENIPGGIPSQKPQGKKKLLTLVLYETQFLDDISELFLELGINGASVTDSAGIGGVLSNVPLFADFLNFLGNHSEQSKTITTIIDENQIQAIVNGIEGIMGDLDAHSGAMVYVTDVTFSKGSFETV